MNNEKLETGVSGKKNTSKVLFIVLGLLVLGIISLFAGAKIFSRLSISADTLPPIPGDPLSEASTTSTPSSTAVASSTTSRTSTATTTVSVSGTSTPPGPGDPTGPPINLTIKAGWSMISGTTLFNFDVSPITQKGIYFYSYNDPYLSNRNWIVSSPTCASQTDFFCTSLNQKFSPLPYTGYFIYNPGSQVTVTLNQVSRLTLSPDNAIYGRGWHLVQWTGSAATKAELMKLASVYYSSQQAGANSVSSSSFENLAKEESHQISNKIYVVLDSSSISSSTVKELSDTDSSTTISKIPQNSYFWVYLRRTKDRANKIVVPYSVSDFFPPSLPNQPAINNNILPPVPPTPN